MNDVPINEHEVYQYFCSKCNYEFHYILSVNDLEDSAFTMNSEINYYWSIIEFEEKCLTCDEWVIKNIIE